MAACLVNEKNELRKNCPCGTGHAYVDCCGLYLSRKKTAPTAEALMRSRYTAYNLIDLDYIARTMKPPAADRFDRKDKKQWAEGIRWTQLEIVKTAGDAVRGFVEFRAHYSLDNKKYILHEISEFSFEEGEWFYVDGIHPEQDIN